MILIDNLNAINVCKENIRTALENKGVDMTDVAFSGYAEKINALQLESGDTPAPTPSADYIYSNGYLENGDEHDIIEFVPCEIVLDSNNQFVVEFICPEEIPGYDGGTYYDVIFTVEVPTTYNIINFELFAEGLNDYVDQAYKANPRHSTVVRNGIVYNSYVRKTLDGSDINSGDVQYSPLKYKITIEKK